MPNLPSRTMEAYKKYESAKTDQERIRYLEEYLSSIPKHKGTERERGVLKRRLALLREGLEKRAERGGGREVSVKKQGAAQVVLAGFPNAGKSSLLRVITNAEARVADYAFTTVEPNVGMLEVKGVGIQIVDLPGLISGAARGKGMGRRFLSIIRNADVIAFFLSMDDKPLERLNKLMHEFEMAGIRINKRRPDVKVYKRGSGGVNILGFHLLTFDKNEAVRTCRDFGIINADIRINHRISLEEFVDAVDKRVVWKRGFAVINKLDLDPEGAKRLKKRIEGEYNLPTITISVKDGTNLEGIKDLIWKICGVMRIYTTADEEPLVLPVGSRVIDAARRIHSELVRGFRFAKVWGKSVKYPGQRVGKEHVLQDGDRIEIN